VTVAGSQFIISRSTPDLDGHVLEKHLSLFLGKIPEGDTNRIFHQKVIHIVLNTVPTGYTVI